MKSSQEEFVLLLKRWQSQASEVAVVVVWGHTSVMPFGSLHLRGRIFELDEKKKFFAVAASPDALENLAMINYSGCKYVYLAESSAEFLKSVAALKHFTAASYDEVASFTTPEEVKISIYAIKQAPKYLSGRQR